MKSKRKPSERWALFGGLALTVSGVAHLVCPSAFEPVNRLAFKTTSVPTFLSTAASKLHSV